MSAEAVDVYDCLEEYDPAAPTESTSIGFPPLSAPPAVVLWEE